MYNLLLRLYIHANYETYHLQSKPLNFKVSRSLNRKTAIARFQANCNFSARGRAILRKVSMATRSLVLDRDVTMPILVRQRSRKIVDKQADKMRTNRNTATKPVQRIYYRFNDAAQTFLLSRRSILDTITITDK